VQENNGPTKLV